MKKKRNNGCLGKGQLYTINGETATIPEFARKYKLHESVIRGRIRSGASDNLIFMSTEEYRRATHFNVTHLQRNEGCSWTQSALDCYEIGATCKLCKLSGDIKRKCCMRDKIIEIVRIYGKPYDRDNNFIKE